MNKTLEIYNALFNDLQTKEYATRNRIHRKYTCKNKLGIIYSLSIGERMRALGIPADKLDKSMSFPIWKGMKIDLVNMPEYADANQVYIELQQIPGTDPCIFEIVAEDLRCGIDLLPSQQGSTKATLERLKRWKDFFATGKVPILTEIKAQGLYGELLFLKELISNFGSIAVNYWSGINNETHDFYIGQNAVEIKTTSRQAPYMAHINSEYQLDTHDVYGKLFLRMYAFRKDTNGGQRLPELIEIIRGMLKNDYLVRNKFDEKLVKAGYLDVAADYYREGYTLRDTYSYEVKDGFPRIEKNSIPKGIYDLEYSIAIAQCMDFAIEAKDLIKGIKR